MTLSATPVSSERLTHLRALEAESIHIFREVASEFENPVMMYSIGKDSSVMLHLALKAVVSPRFSDGASKTLILVRQPQSRLLLRMTCRMMIWKFQHFCGVQPTIRRLPV